MASGPPKHLHGGRELAQRLVEVVHLRQYAANGDDGEGVGRWMCKLIIAVECQFQSYTERFH